MPDPLVRATLEGLGIDPGRPLLGQFAPIDHRFAPLAALGTYWLVRGHVPEVQIVLAETAVAPAARRPSGYAQVTAAAAGDPNVHLLPAAAELGAPEINALQRGCTVALQMAVPRGFGWGLAECQWKGKPALVGSHGELPAQVVNGSGHVVDAAPTASERVLEFLADPKLAARVGARGHNFIARNHLTTRLAHDYIELLRRIAVRNAGPALVGRTR
jgi:trehalose synthase